MTASLADFLAARLADDERVAKMAAQPDPRWEQEDADRYPGSITDGSRERVVYDEGSPSAEQAAHIARHDPARVLREVAAHRAILAEYECLNGDNGADEWLDGKLAGLREVLVGLAAVYSDHPDYLPAWAPEAVST